MGYYDLLRNYIDHSPATPDEKIDIEDAFISSPKTPDSLETKVAKMNVFDGKILRECIISNICTQLNSHKGSLKQSTWSNLLKFLDQDFDNVSDTNKIYIQVLVHFSKLSISEDMLAKHGFSSMESIDFYEKILKEFIAEATEPLTDDTLIKEMEEVTELKRRMLSQPILLAIQKNISKLETPSIIPYMDVDCISKLITSAHIYETKFFGPFDVLRGAALLDGILICTSNVAGRRGTAKYCADLLTLAVHEVSHHIICLLFDDFNFSSPWKYRVSDVARFDFHPTNPQLLEFGRNTELVLFDDIQPNWYNSANEAAVTFLERIDANLSSLPVIRKNEHAQVALSARYPSHFFGIDIRPQMVSII